MSEPASHADIRVAIFEPRRQRREGLAAMIESTPGYKLSGCFGTVADALEELDLQPPEVALVGRGEDAGSVSEIARFRLRYPAVNVLVLASDVTEEEAFRAIWAGATGYLIDAPPDRLLAAIRELREGGAPMSPKIARAVVTEFQKRPPLPPSGVGLSRRELDTLRLLGAGHSYKTAAAQLGLSIDTVRFHVRNIYEKLHVHSKVEAVMKAARDGLVP